MKDNTDYYSEKFNEYYTSVRDDVIELVPGKIGKVLDLGCGDGSTIRKLKAMGIADEIVGVDMNIEAPGLDNFISGDLETINIPYPERYFDLLILADILEHLVDPWKFLNNKKLLVKPGGYIITSMPNIREKRALQNIIFKGDFKYVDAGILDKTHLRFFCKKNMIELLKNSGLIILDTNCVMPGWKRPLFNKLSFRIFEEFFVEQYIILSQLPK